MRSKKLVILLVSAVLVIGLAVVGILVLRPPATEPIAEPEVPEEEEVVEEEVPEEEEVVEEEVVERNPYATPDMEFDLGGRVIRVVSWWDMTITGEDPDTLQQLENLAELQEKHNFSFEYIAIDFGEYRDKIVASLMAAAPVGDIVRVGRAYAFPSLVERDFFWEVGEYTKNYNAFSPIWGEISQYDGRIYGFGGPWQGMATGFFYNRTLEKRLGIKPLQEYINEGNWNWDTFIQVAKDANRDTDGDGIHDVWGLAGGGFLEPALSSNATDLIEGREQNLDDPRVIETFEFIARLAAEGVPRPTEGGDWREPEQFFIQGNTLMFAGSDWQTGGLTSAMPDFELGFVPFPMGPSATAYHANEPLAQFLTIPKVVENHRELLYIWERLHDIDSVYDYVGQGWYETLFVNEDDINNLRVAAAGMRTSNIASFPALPFWPIVGDLNAGISVSTVIETYMAQVQAAIDEVFLAIEQ